MVHNFSYLRSCFIYFTEITLKEKEHKESYVTTNKTDPQPETVNILKKKLQYEIEFYEWLKTRFYAGLNSLSWHETRKKITTGQPAHRGPVDATTEI